MASCPSPDELRRVLFAALGVSADLELVRHLGACPRCRARAGRLAARHLHLSFLAATPTPPSVRTRLEALKGSIGALAEVGELLHALPRRGGRSYFDRYEVEAVAGAGAMGLVLRARDPVLDRWVALKILRAHLAADSRARTMFLAEARAIAAVEHENVVAIHAVDEYVDRPYLVMQWVEGESLQARIAAGAVRTVEHLLRVAVHVARGLAAAHAKGVVHRDINPRNLLLERVTDRVKIVDFGLAGVRVAAKCRKPGAVVGTPGYCAPECLEGSAGDERSDLFSLGATLRAASVGVRGAAGQVHLPEPFVALVRTLQLQDPRERPATAREVATRCEAMLGDRAGGLGCGDRSRDRGIPRPR
ncbi:MAG: serine/threonine-protein kinase [Planctomycetota bacterium]